MHGSVQHGSQHRRVEHGGGCDAAAHAECARPRRRCPRPRRRASQCGAGGAERSGSCSGPHGIRSGATSEFAELAAGRAQRKSHDTSTPRITPSTYAAVWRSKSSISSRRTFRSCARLLIGEQSANSQQPDAAGAKHRPPRMNTTRARAQQQNRGSVRSGRCAARVCCAAHPQARLAQSQTTRPGVPLRPILPTVLRDSAGGERQPSVMAYALAQRTSVTLSQPRRRMLPFFSPSHAP